MLIYTFMQIEVQRINSLGYKKRQTPELFQMSFCQLLSDQNALADMF